MPDLAPIALFCYNRLDHLKKVLTALAANTLASRSILYTFSDGPKDNEEDLTKVSQVRQLIHSASGFAEIHIQEAETNQMLAPSLLQGISQVLEQHDRIIVIEDDILVNSYFLEYMNETLELYQNEERVGMIHGHVVKVRGLPNLFFNRQSGCWGWGTWQRAWSRVNTDGTALLAQIRTHGREREFNADGAYPFTQMLQQQVLGLNGSWAIRVYASFFLQGILTLYPGKSMSVHIGYDGGAHHQEVRGWDPSQGSLYYRKIKATVIPIQENIQALVKVRKIVSGSYQRRIWNRSKNFGMRQLRKINRKINLWRSS